MKFSLSPIFSPLLFSIVSTVTCWITDWMSLLPIMYWINKNIGLNFVVCERSLSNRTPLQMIANHQMPGVSFASGGDPVSKPLNVLFIWQFEAEQKKKSKPIRISTFWLLYSKGHDGFCGVCRKRCDWWQGMFRLGMRRRAGSRCDHNYRTSIWVEIQTVHEQSSWSNTVRVHISVSCDREKHCIARLKELKGEKVFFFLYSSCSMLSALPFIDLLFRLITFPE